MRTWISVFALCLVPQLLFGQEKWRPTFLGQTNCKHAAFIEVFQSEDESLAYEDRWSLYVSTFDALALSQFDDVYYMASPGRFLDTVDTWGDSNLVIYDTSAYWPNDIIYMPSTVVGTEGIVQTSGFLVTTKKDGQLQIYDTTTGSIPVLMANIAEGDSDEWSYHRVIWQDMDLDGDSDAVTARFHFPNIGSIKTEFVWFENPDSTSATSGWTEHVISSEGPDVSFAKARMRSGGRDYDVFVFAEFFTERIELFWTENEDNDWSDTASISSRVINPNAGQTFDVMVDDLNRDGVDELVFTEFNTTANTGHVKVYFIPADFKTDEFDSVVIADGFVPNSGLGGESMSPGSPKTYYPSTYYADEVAADGLPHKPWLLVSGDDDGRMYILYPPTDDRDDWTYQKHILVDTENDTVGKMTTGDLDGDGYEEIIVAGYSSGQIYVYTYNPAAYNKTNST